MSLSLLTSGSLPRGDPPSPRLSLPGVTAWCEAIGDPGRDPSRGSPRAAWGEWLRAEDREAPGVDQSRPPVGVFVIHMEETRWWLGQLSPSARRAATSAAVVLASRGGQGAEMELRAPRGLPHLALCGEQGKTPRRRQAQYRRGSAEA